MAIAFFNEMVKTGIKPDHIIFVHLLHACTHAGLADEALDYYNKIHTVYGVKYVPAHHSCIIDALSRCGRLDEAENLLNNLPHVDVMDYKTLLGACRTYVCYVWNSGNRQVMGLRNSVYFYVNHLMCLRHAR